jgi:hypothetical protein
MVQASKLVKQTRSGRFKTVEPTRRQKRLSALHRTKMREFYQVQFKLGKPVDEKQTRRK